MGRRPKERPPKQPHHKQRLDLVDALELEREIIKRSFRDFIPQAFEIMEGGDAHASLVRRGLRPPKFVSGWHIDAIADHLQAVAQGEMPRLLINIPPGTMKSVLACVLWPAWLWGCDPTQRFLFSSYSEEFTKRDARRTKALLSSAWYQALFPGTRLAATPDTAMEHHTTAGGERHGASTNSGVTGKHVHGIVEDDPLKMQDASSKCARDEAWDYRTQALGFRLLPENSWRVVIMQRLHEDDPSGRILSRGGRDDEEAELRDSYVHLCLPMEYEPERRCVTKLFADPRTEAGELLWPQRMNAKFVQEKKSPQGLGEYGYAGQGQQRPAPAEGGIIKRAWLRYWLEYPEDLEFIIQSWDFPVKKTGKSFAVGFVFGFKAPNTYLLDRFRAHTGFADMLAAARRMNENWPDCREKLIEDKASGSDVIETVREEIPGIVPVTPVGSKEERLVAVSYIIEAGNLFVPHPSIAPWVHEVIDEWCTFPNATNDDQVDTLSQALKRLYGHKRPKKPSPLRLGGAGERTSPWEM